MGQKVSVNEKALIEICAEYFEENAVWIGEDELIQEYVKQGFKYVEGLASNIRRYYGFKNNDQKIELSALALATSETSRQCADAILRLSQLCSQIALKFDSSIKIDRDMLNESFPNDQFIQSHAIILLEKIPGLTSGGNGSDAQSPWYRNVSTTALGYLEIDSLEKLIAKLSADAKSLYPEFQWIDGSSESGLDADYPDSPTGQSDYQGRKKIFVIHGRDHEVKDAMFNYLNQIGLEPLDWDELVPSATPYNLDIVDYGFKNADAAVVIFTPDDEVRLHRELSAKGSSQSNNFSIQPRANVFFEAGMAHVHFPKKTVYVQFGESTLLTDLLGHNILRLDGNKKKEYALADRLRSAGCPGQIGHPNFKNRNFFEDLAAYSRSPLANSDMTKQDSEQYGKHLPSEGGEVSLQLTARVLQIDASNYIVDIQNRSEVDALDLSFEFINPESGWSIDYSRLPHYPIRELKAYRSLRIPVAIAGSSEIFTDFKISALDPQENAREFIETLSKFG